MLEIRKVRQTGDSLSVGIPYGMVKEMAVKDGDYMSIVFENEKMIVEPLHQSTKINAATPAHEPSKVGEPNE